MLHHAWDTANFGAQKGEAPRKWHWTGERVLCVFVCFCVFLKAGLGKVIVLNFFSLCVVYIHFFSFSTRVLNSRYVGPDFHHSIRYPQGERLLCIFVSFRKQGLARWLFWIFSHLCTHTFFFFSIFLLFLWIVFVVLFVCMAYSTGIPILYLVLSATAFSFYWVDKYLFTRWYRTPPQYDAQISRQFSGYLPYAALLHLCFGIWMIANKRMFSSDSSYDINIQTKNAGKQQETEFHQNLLAYVGESNGKKTDILNCLSQRHVGPMLVALAGWIVYLAVLELWHFVGPLLKKLLRCLTWFVNICISCALFGCYK